MAELNILAEIINAIYRISPASVSAITNAAEIENYKADANVISVNKKNNKEYFVLEGICGSYLTNTEGEDVYISFFPEKSVFSPHTTRTSNGASLLNFKALSDVTLACIDAKVFEKMIVDNLEIREFANTVLRNELHRKVEKEIDHASLSAKDRLVKFRILYPTLENRIPHPVIASYLGITNVSLSRLRKTIR